jgi:hypothetical protein
MKDMPSITERHRRQLFDLNIASNKRVLEQKTIIRGNGNHLSMLHERYGNDSNESQGLNVANAVLRDGAELLGTPVQWIKDMQQHWLAYVVCAAVIMVCLLICYGIVRFSWARRTNSTAALATILAMKNIVNTTTTKPVTDA